MVPETQKYLTKILSSLSGGKCGEQDTSKLSNITETKAQEITDTLSNHDTHHFNAMF